MATLPARLPRIIPPTATLPIPHVDRVVGPGRVDGDHIMPAVAVWALELRAGLKVGRGVHGIESVPCGCDRGGQAIQALPLRP